MNSADRRMSLCRTGIYFSPPMLIKLLLLSGLVPHATFNALHFKKLGVTEPPKRSHRDKFAIGINSTYNFQFATLLKNESH